MTEPPDEARGGDHIGCLFNHEHRYPECYDDALPAPLAGADEAWEHAEHYDPDCEECVYLARPVILHDAREREGPSVERLARMVHAASMTRCGTEDDETERRNGGVPWCERFAASMLAALLDTLTETE